ncbi:MAG: ATP-dependent helicase [Fusobacterium sp.]|nr:ATP-dependent helicase [Fusobacterium sp.]
MLINGSLSANKTEFLIERYVELLNKGVPASKILVLVQNSTLKQAFVDKVLERLEINGFEKLKIHSFFSLVYNTVSDNWAVLEGINPDKTRSVILPNLIGLEVSQYILKDIIRTIKFRGYNSRKSLLHQIFRRYSLIVQNNLSAKEVEERAKILKEPFKEDIDLTLKLFLQKTLKLRSFDYLRQCLVFNYIYKNTDYFKGIEYLIVDDGDEITPVCFDFIEHLAPQLKDWWLAYDFKGSSRVGYLSADKPAVWEFERLFKEKTVEFEPLGEMWREAEKLFDNVLYDKENILANFEFQSPSKRSGMVEMVAREIKTLLDGGALPCEISLVTPCVDEMLKFTLKEKLGDRLNLKPLSGSEKLVQNRLVLSVLNILKLNTDLRGALTELNLRPIFNDFLNIPLKYCDKILSAFEESKTLIEFEFPNPEHSEKYGKFLEFLGQLGGLKLSQQAFEIFDKFAFLSACSKEEICKFNFFLKELKDFEDVFDKDIEGHEAEILLQIENSIISENPYSTLDVGENDLILSTPQKIIDNQICTKYQFWLDVSSQEWVKSDIGPLYNAWVYQKGWEKDDFTVEDNLRLSKDKTARILRKLTLLAAEKVYVYSSLFDGNGLENFGGIEEYIKVSQTVTKSDGGGFRITPRDDQKPVLEYRAGKMAISAVPGAGKTTILLALIVKLLECKVPAENIFVMTYMESAARNFRDRIKNIFPDSAQLPNISTIHGLALRILKENNNFERLGLSGDFEICDDTVRGRIIRAIAVKTGVQDDELADFDRAVSIAKFAQFENPQSTDPKINKFLKFFAFYRQTLAGQNLIDYDDILLYSVQLLERFEDVREYYQNICHFIIEDEAQDSSSLQQRLINLLSAKHGNLIRCGDINQAITTTFSNADVAGFWRFIEESQKVSMDCSQRCTKDVWTLANNLILWSETKGFLQGSFYQMFMRPVEGRNPVSQNAVRANVFPTPKDEKDFIVKEIRNIFKHDPKATVGILLRSNFQVNTWASHIENSGLKTITRTECLAQKLIFRVIFAILKVVLSPFDNDIAAGAYEILAELGAFKYKNTNFIREAKVPFVQLNPDEIEDVEFSRFYWEILYWVSHTSLSPEQLAMKIGLHYFSSEIEKSNVYLIATLVKRLSLNTNGLRGIVQQLEELSRKNRVSGFNFFSEEDENDKGFFEGKIQIMTMHKSKGDEFDYVFIPELTERNLTFEVSELKLKPSDNFNENLRRLSHTYQPKTQKDIMKGILTENLKLLYVAITRARRYLYISTYEKSRPNDKYTKVNVIFRELLGGSE